MVDTIQTVLIIALFIAYIAHMGDHNNGGNNYWVTAI